MPTPEEIAAKCAEIRATWTPRQTELAKVVRYVRAAILEVKEDDIGIRTKGNIGW